VGMTVAADVKNLDDMLIIPVGSVLTERHINLLESWGVAEVNVEASKEVEPPADPLSLLPPETLAHLTTETRARFRDFDEADPIQREVLRLVLRRKARQLLHP